MPSGTDTSSANAMAAAASSRLIGSRSPSRLTTVWLSRMERPKSPWTSLPTQSAYCTGTGRSRLNSVRMAAAASGEVCVPSMICTGSPGVARVTRKMVSETTSRTSGTCSSRRER